MSEVEILEAAQAIMERLTAKNETERAVYRDTVTGLLWARTDIIINRYAA